MSVEAFIKEEYQQLFNLLHRVEVKGIAEANALVALAKKLDGHINAPTVPTGTEG